MTRLPTLRGRGVTPNPSNRFERVTLERDPSTLAEDPAPRTQFFKDSTRSIVARNTSPDVGFEVSINPYRGCEHGCAYCYARPTHEYLGLSAGLDFKSKIFIKQDAPQLLRNELSSPRWRPNLLTISWHHCVNHQVRCSDLTEFRNPVMVITKNFLVTRDLDLLTELASLRSGEGCDLCDHLGSHPPKGDGAAHIESHAKARGDRAANPSRRAGRGLPGASDSRAQRP